MFEGLVKTVAIFQGLGAALTLGMTVFMAADTVRGQESPDGIALFVFGLFLVAGALQAAIAVGLWRRLRWARTGALTIAIVLLFTGGGTIVGLLTLFSLLHPKGRALFFPSGAAGATPGVEGSAPSLD